MASEFYDPVFSAEERSVLRALGAEKVEPTDQRLQIGLGNSHPRELLLFFLPHCPHEIIAELVRWHKITPSVPVVVLGNDPTPVGKVDVGVEPDVRVFPLLVPAKSYHYLAFSDTSVFALCRNSS